MKSPIYELRWSGVYLGRFKANVRIDDTMLINGTPSEVDDLFSECPNDADGRGWSFVLGS